MPCRAARIRGTGYSTCVHETRRGRRDEETHALRLRSPSSSGSTATLVAVGRSAHKEEPGLQDASQAAMLTPGAGRDRGAADHCRRDAAGHQLHVRVDPRRDRVPEARATAATRRSTSTSMSTTRPRPCRSRSTRRPASAFNELHERMVSKLTLNRKSGGILDGKLCDPERRELPALLLEHARRPRAKASSRPMLFTNEEATDWVEQDGHRVARAARRGHPEPGRSRGRLRRQERQGTNDLRHGPPQPREQRRYPRLRASRSMLSGDDTFSAPGAVPALLVHREERARHVLR